METTLVENESTAERATSSVEAKANTVQDNEDEFSDYESLKNSTDLLPEESADDYLCSKLVSTFVQTKENDSQETEDENYESFPNSADLFPDESTENSLNIDFSEDTTEYNSQNSPNASGLDDEEMVLLDDLNRTPACCIPLSKLEPLENHSIMFSPHLRAGDPPRPFPNFYKDKWDTNHVRMPCSAENKYPIENVLGVKHITSRWDLICESLRKDIQISKDLENAILSYNSQYIGRWKFDGLHMLLNKSLKQEEADHFFEVILPVMIEMALDLPNVCTRPIPLLKKGKDHYITMSQKQIACLLLNAFFCTFPRRTVFSKNPKYRLTSEYSNFPDINFNRLFSNSRNVEKLKCLLNYFRRVTSNVPSGTVTFHRQSLKERDFPEWSTSKCPIGKAVIMSSGVIEGSTGLLQVDFANKYIGGGVLGQGCVQEEIRFVICPELIVSRLFVEALAPNEVLIITGVEQYSKYSGYAETFKWGGDFKDQTPRDTWGRRYTQLVAMDATSFKNTDVQFKPHFILKDLNKAYCGFYENAMPGHLSAIATGNWGCGAFKGHPKLKFLIQLMAASEAGRGLLYITFRDQKLQKELQKMYNFLIKENLTVGELWNLLLNYGENVSEFGNTSASNLYNYIFSHLITKRENSR